MDELIKRLLLLSLLLSTTSLYAEEIPVDTPWYEIEIVLFEHDSQPGEFKEHLAEQAIIPELVDALELAPPFTKNEGASTVTETAYQRLSASQLKLSSQFNYIEKSSRYRPLQHIGWRQPGLERGVAPAILIYPYATDEEATLEDYLEQANKLPAQAESDEEWQERVYAFGYIRLILSRYLHIESNLLLSVPVQVESPQLPLESMPLPIAPMASSYDYQYLAGNETSPLLGENRMMTEYRYFHIDENRRIRKNELHYFDHPRFGMLLLVRDYHPPKEETAITQ